MRNLISALLAGGLTTMLLVITGLLSAYEASVPGFLAVVIVYFLLARRTFKSVENVMTQATQAMSAMPPKFDLAVRTMEQAYAFAPAQFGVRSQVDAQIGMLHFLKKDFKKAEPYLSRALQFAHWMAGAMLGVIYYKRKDSTKMKATFKIVLKKGKKSGLAWNLYAYLLSQSGEKDEAQKILAEGLKATGNDQRVQESLLALQNNKKMKMRGYNEQWYQFHLDRPPQQQMRSPHQPRMGKAARRGRWG